MHFSARSPGSRDAERVVRVLAVYDGDAARSRQVVQRVVDELGAVLGSTEFAAAVVVRELDISLEPSRKAQRARCRAAELVVGLDARHLHGLAQPLLARHRVFTLEELTLTLETVANSSYGRAVVSILERGLPAFSRSVIAVACAVRGIVPARVRAPRRADDVEEYAGRLARAIGELAIGRALSS
ncbi:hypothetical protein [Agrococcus baldri]|uniref:Uncharacterized protein n=1 Tax=Agrococcus baldri TaxID=153730 RepID=A0AA87RG07_9MICO|nr:hypothetical protein [Agrococcus baldri]GEK79705.1 hypothetical protein ABA31_10560 [Agrococcus baldri]